MNGVMETPATNVSFSGFTFENPFSQWGVPFRLEDSKACYCS